jgi:hypothetical protein
VGAGGRNIPSQTDFMAKLRSALDKPEPQANHNFPLEVDNRGMVSLDFSSVERKRHLKKNSVGFWSQFFFSGARTAPCSSSEVGKDEN